MTEQDRRQAKADELQMMIAREAVSLAAIAVLMLLMHPGVNLRLRQLARRIAAAAAPPPRTAPSAEDLAALGRDIARFEGRTP